MEVTGIYNSLSVDGGLDPFEELFTKIRIIELFFISIGKTIVSGHP